MNVMQPLQYVLASSICVIFFTPVRIAGHSVTSPDGKIFAALDTNNGSLSYTLSYQSRELLIDSSMGVVRLDGDFSHNLALAQCTDPSQRQEKYSMIQGKQREIDTTYSAINCTYINSDSEPMVVELLASDTSFAFRYNFPRSDNVSAKYIPKEATSFRIVKSPSDYQLLQPMDDPTPKYQTFYQPRANRTKSSIGMPVSKVNFGLPAFFKTDVDGQAYFLHIKETGFDGRYPVTSISNSSVGNNFELAFPDLLDGNGNMGDSRPHSSLPWSTPWRIITLGTSPAAIVEDTSVTDLAFPSIYPNASFVKPAVGSWSWWSNPNNPLNYTQTQAFIDLASEQGWAYSVLDAQWDQQRDALGQAVSLRTIADYARSKGVRLWTWMNSAGDNNDASILTKTPKDLLFQNNIRKDTIRRFVEEGVAGFKVDGIQSNKQEMVAYLLDILLDAGQAGLQIIFHNCFPPHGWERTFPHLLGTEGLIANEYYTNARIEYGSQMPENNVNEAFVRYPVGPADYSAGTFTRDTFASDPVITTDAHELALAVIIDTGIRIWSETPEAIQRLNPSIVQTMSTIPFVWDETKFIAGEPGKYFIVGRKSGSTLYVAGINGETTYISTQTDRSDPLWKPAQGSPRHVAINLDLAAFGLGEKIVIHSTVYSDAVENKTALVTTGNTFGALLNITMEPFGGFLAKFDFAS